jgi:osmotically-inducible protein OsmY
MTRALLSLIAIAGLAAGVLHFTGYRKGRRPAPAQAADDSILQAVRDGLSPAIDVRVRDGVVALRGTASPAERDRALTHALSIPGVRRVYSDLEDGRSILETGAAKTGIAHPR